MSKQKLMNTRQEQPRHTSEASHTHAARGATDHSETSREQVAALAYELWESHGRPDGTDVDDWLLAERRLRNRA